MNSGDLVRFLLAHHALTTEELVDRGIELIDNVRDRFAVRKLRIGKVDRLMLKQAVSNDGFIRLQQEITTFKFLGSLPGAKQVLPLYYCSDDVGGLLAMEFIESTTPPSDVAHDRSSSALEWAGFLGTALGSLHRHSNGICPPGLSMNLPGILGIHEPSPRWAPPSIRMVLSQASDPNILSSGLAASRSVWSPRCVIHGDIKWEHCLYEATKGIRFIDWELACYGDPAWDVASVVHEFVILFHASTGHLVRGGASPWKIALANDSMPPALRMFLAQYVRTVLPDVESDRESFIERVVLLLGARLFQTSLELAMLKDRSHSDDGSALHIATSVFRDASEVSARFMEEWPA